MALNRITGDVRNSDWSPTQHVADMTRSEKENLEVTKQTYKSPIGYLLYG